MTMTMDTDPRRSSVPGTLHRATGRERAWALFVHGSGLGTEAAEALVQGFTRRGVGVLRVTEVHGDPVQEARALQQAAAWLRSELHAPQLLLAHGEAGAAALLAGLELQDCRAIALVGAPANKTVLERIGELEPALLVVQTASGPVEAARALYEAAPHPKGLMAVDADGDLSERADAEHTGELVATWAVRWLREERPVEQGPTEVHVSIERARFATHVVARRHAFVVDEPTSLDGTDLGPDPYELLLASLGSCIAITLRMYADRKGWPLEAVRVRLTHEAVHADDAEGCERERRAIDQVETTLALEGELDPAQRARLLEIADRCPIHRTLESGVRLPKCREAS